MKISGILNKILALMKQPHKEKKGEPRHLTLTVSDTITMRESFGLKSFAASSKKFITHIISGWFPSIRKDLSPDGVNKVRVVDRKNNFYKEKVVDEKTGRVIRDVEEKLTDHK